MSTYVCSDIHGCLDRFNKLLTKLDMQADDYLYILGDVIDRGDDGIEILKMIMNNPNITLLLGNHEWFMYDYLKKLDDKGLLDISDNFPGNFWLYPNNGGDKTLEKFVKEPLEMKRKILDFISQLDVIKIIEVNGEKFHLSHTGTIEGVLEKDTWNFKEFTSRELDDITMNSVFRYDYWNPLSLYPPECMCIVGHVPVQRVRANLADYSIYKMEHRIINIDGGCALRPYEHSNENIETAIACLCLDNMEEMYIQ